MTTRYINSVTAGPVRFGSYATISVTSQGGVTATGVAVYDTGVLVNSGLISGSKVGVVMSPSESFTNQSGGLIKGGGGGIYALGTVTNAGTITGGSYAVQFFIEPGNRLVVDPGAVFTGTVEGGGVGNALEFASGAGSGTLAGLGSKYVSFAEVSVDAGANWTATGANSIVAGQTLVVAGSLRSTGQFTNLGTVDVATSSFVQYGGTFANNGSVSVTGDSEGITADSGSLITNAAAARITGGAFVGVQVYAGATLVNAGLISSGRFGGVNSDGMVTNLAGGTVAGTTYGFSGVGGTLINAGTIAAGSSTDASVKFLANVNARVVVDPGAVFVGTVDGFNTIGAAATSTLEFASAAGYGTFAGLGSHYVNFAAVSVDARADWTASGINTVVAGATLTDAGSLVSTGTFINAGLVDTGARGIAQHGGTFANYGSVFAAAGLDVDVDDGGLVTNTSTGTITGSAYEGVFVGSATLVNAGLISGGQYGGVNSNGIVTNLAGGVLTGTRWGFSGTGGTLINAGTVAAGNSANDAVHFLGPTDARVVVDPGAVFVGTVNGFNAIGSTATSTLEFASAATGGTLAGLGSQYVNFAQVSVDTSADWTAAGANTIAAGQTLTVAGLLRSAGQFTNAGTVDVGQRALVQYGGTFANNGRMSVAGSVGITIDGGGLVTNAAAARITGAGAIGVAVRSGATLVNAGLISGGIIGGAYADTGAVVTNLAGGTIAGTADGFGEAGATLINAGTVAAGSSTGDAVKVVAAANARVVVDPGAVFVGTVDGYNTIGSTAASTLEFASGASGGTFAGLGSQYVNFAAVSVDVGATWTASGVNSVAAGATISDAGTFVSVGRFTNAGVVDARTTGIEQFGGAFANDGSVNAGGSVGVYALGGGLVTNAATGTITGGTREGVVVGVGGTLVNAGLIRGGQYGGADAYGGGVVTNLAGGTIAGTTYGFSGAGVTLINSGTVAAASSMGDAVHDASGFKARVAVGAGAVFVGTVNGGNAIGAAAVSTLEFTSGASGGTFAGLGSQYVNFAAISVDTGANWTASGANTLAAGATLTDGGALTFASAPVGGGDLMLSGHGITLASEGGASIGLSILGLAGNAVELVGTVEHLASLAGHELALDGGTTLTLAGNYSGAQVSVTNDGANTFITACFASGTTVATARGAVAVEALSVGERVVTASGRLAPVGWIGFRRVDLVRHARPFEVMPVRVRAGALGDGVPGRDLVLSPDHAVWVEGYLVPVRYLINGRSIVQERRDSVTYWHVELDRHDLVLAEGVACESYLDTGNRGAFENGADAVALHPEFGREHALAVWQAASCAPILFDPAEPALRARHLRLMVRAERLARAA